MLNAEAVFLGGQLGGRGQSPHNGSLVLDRLGLLQGSG
jgi:hypothetical protein